MNFEMSYLLEISYSEVLDNEEKTKRLSFTLRELFELDILKTPRDVNRLINSFALGIHGVGPLVIDLGDLLLRCAIQLKFPNVYEWIYQYSETTLSESSPVIEETTKITYLERLQNAYETDGLELSHLEEILERLIPNINWSFSK